MYLTAPLITIAQSPMRQIFNSSVRRWTLSLSQFTVQYGVRAAGAAEERRARARAVALKAPVGVYHTVHWVNRVSESQHCSIVSSINPVLLYISTWFTLVIRKQWEHMWHLSQSWTVTEKWKLAFIRSFSKQAPIISRCVSKNFQPNTTSLHWIRYGQCAACSNIIVFVSAQRY